MDGGFFLIFHHEEFVQNIKGIMLIGYERKWGEAEPSIVTPLPVHGGGQEADTSRL
jgi:hypothetical protein